MARYEITSPDGGRYEVTAPDDATEDQLKAYVEQQLKTTAPPAAQNAQQAPSVAPQAPNAPGWSDVPVEALKNVPASAGRFFGGIYDALTSPAETAKALVDLGTGAARAGMRAVAPDFTARRDAAMIEDNPESAAQSARADALASGAWEALKNRYGGSEEIRRTLATDPVGVASDLSLITGIGASLAPGRAGSVLSATSHYTNPITPAAAAARGIGNAAQTVAKSSLGLTTGAGGEAIAGAYRAGRAGGEAGETFRQNIRGEVPTTSVVEDAKAALGDMRNQMTAEYRANRAIWEKGQQVADIKPIEVAFNDFVKSTQVGGFSKLGAGEQAAVRQIGSIIEEFKNTPQAQNIAGLDALKQRIQAILPDNPADRQTMRLVTQVSNAVKTEIGKQAPSYASAMKAYWDRLSEINEIEKGLSLGGKASTDTALRKLTSITRNNVNTNFGRRVELAEALKKGGADIMPAVSGQALNTWTPRGIMGGIAPYGFAGLASLSLPHALAALPFQSPRLVGNAAYGSGNLARGLSGNIGDFQGRAAMLNPAIRDVINPALQGINTGVRRGAGAVRQNAPMLEHLGDLYDLRENSLRRR